MKYLKCHCCGRYTLEAGSLFDICDNCGWQGDPVQNEDPDFTGGANEMSLSQAKEAYRSGKNIKIRQAQQIVAVQVFKDKTYLCPLVNREIPGGYCYDIIMVAYGYIKPSAIDDEIPENTADICGKCPFNQLLYE